MATLFQPTQEVKREGKMQIRKLLNNKSLDNWFLPQAHPFVVHLDLQSHFFEILLFTKESFIAVWHDCSSLVVKVTDSWPAGNDFELSTTEDSPCRGADARYRCRSKNVLPLVRNLEEGKCRLRSHPRQLTLAQNYDVRHQKPSRS
ncbi:hypothetical protein TNCV_5031941 [Trichonephila clavipes]|nr:hypothetical protein TNCV_5031941 [Trichonephila clavipes]